MFVVIYEPETDVVLYSRRMGPNEHMDERVFADMIANRYGQKIAEPDGYIPNCSGDIRVEFRPSKNNSVHIWGGQSFYFKDLEEPCA